MFESMTKRERMSVKKAGLVIAITAALLGLQATALTASAAKPLDEALAAVARSERPTFGEEITVTASSRPHGRLAHR